MLAEILVNPLAARMGAPLGWIDSVVGCPVDSIIHTGPGQPHANLISVAGACSRIARRESILLLTVDKPPLGPIICLYTVPGFLPQRAVNGDEKVVRYCFPTGNLKLGPLHTPRNTDSIAVNNQSPQGFYDCKIGISKATVNTPERTLQLAE